MTTLTGLDLRPLLPLWSWRWRGAYEDLLLCQPTALPLGALHWGGLHESGYGEVREGPRGAHVRRLVRLDSRKSGRTPTLPPTIREDVEELEEE